MTRHQGALSARRYVEQFRVSLGVRDVQPDRADELVREIEAHLEASGEDAEETFGKPWELAEALAAAGSSPPPQRDPLGMGALALTAFVAPWLVLQGATPLLSGEQAVLTLAHAASVAAGLAAVPFALPAAFAFLDGRRSIWPAIGVFTVAIAVVVGVYLVVPAHAVYEGSGWPLVILGVLGLVATAALINRRARRRVGTTAADRRTEHARHRGARPVAAQSPNPVRRVLDTEALRGASSGARAVAIVAVLLTGVLGGWALAAQGPDVPGPLLLVWGLLLGGLIGDAWGERRGRRHDEDRADGPSGS